MPRELGKPIDALLATGRALVNRRFGLCDSASVRGTVCVATARALGLRQNRQNSGGIRRHLLRAEPLRLAGLVALEATAGPRRAAATGVLRAVRLGLEAGALACAAFVD